MPIIKAKNPTFDQALNDLRSYGFDVRELPGVAGELRVEKNGVGAVLKRLDNGKSAVLTANPGYILGGEISRLLDKGNQKFLKTSKLEIPATANHLRAVHLFSEELRERTGSQSFYNESLGTVSDIYHYDRVKGRDLPESQRPVAVWEQPVRTV
jgi:hypothetical protein